MFLTLDHHKLAKIWSWSQTVPSFYSMGLGQCSWWELKHPVPSLARTLMHHKKGTFSMLCFLEV